MRALKITAAVFTTVSDASTTQQRLYQSCRGSKNYISEFPVLVQRNEYGKPQNLATIPSWGEVSQILNIKKLDLASRAPLFSFRVTCVIYYISREVLHLNLLIFLGI